MKKFSDLIPNVVVKHQTYSLLQKRDLNQNIRRELCFGLIPKTLNRKSN